MPIVNNIAIAEAALPLQAANYNEVIYSAQTTNLVMQAGSSYNLLVALNKPAIGDEVIQLNYSSLDAINGIDFTISPFFSNSTLISFVSGQTSASFIIKSLNNGNQPNKHVAFSLTNPNFSTVGSFGTFVIELQSSLPVPSYVGICIPQIITQLGAAGSNSYTQLRYNPTDTSITSYPMALLFGTNVKGPWVNNNYTQNYSFVGNAWWAEYKWGENINDLIMSATNAGTYPVLYNNKIINVGDTIAFDLSKYTVNTINEMSGTTLLFPTNDGLVINILTRATWNINFSFSYLAGGLVLKNSTNGVAQMMNSGSTFSGPNFSLLGFSNANAALQNQNVYFLMTDYDKMQTGRNYISGPLMCPVQQNYQWAGNSVYESARILGLYFLDNNSLTTYDGFNWIQGGNFIQTCGSVLNIYNNGNNFVQPIWNSIPFSAIT